MSEVKWFKITTNVFDDEKIKLMEMMPDGDTIIVIWFKLIALAAKANNNGIIMFTDTIPYTEDLLVSYLGKKDTTTRLAFETFKKWDMLQIIEDDLLLITNFNKYQNVKGLDDIRKQNRIRQKKYRDKQRLLLENKEKEEIKNIEYIEENNVKRNVTDYVGLMNYYNSLDNLPNITKLTDKRKTHIKARLQSRTEDELKALWKQANETSFLIGDNDRGWKASFDWLIKEDNLVKLEEGKYQDQSNKQDINVDWIDDYAKNL